MIWNYKSTDPTKFVFRVGDILVNFNYVTRLYIREEDRTQVEVHYTNNDSCRITLKSEELAEEMLNMIFRAVSNRK